MPRPERVRLAGPASLALIALLAPLVMNVPQTSIVSTALVLGIVEILLAFWVAGSFRTSAIFLVAYVGIIALSRGITELFVAFKLKGLRKQLATV